MQENEHSEQKRLCIWHEKSLVFTFVAIKKQTRKHKQHHHHSHLPLCLSLLIALESAQKSQPSTNILFHSNYTMIVWKQNAWTSLPAAFQLSKCCGVFHEDSNMTARRKPLFSTLNPDLSLSWDVKVATNFQHKWDISGQFPFSQKVTVN